METKFVLAFDESLTFITMCLPCIRMMQAKNLVARFNLKVGPIYEASLGVKLGPITEAEAQRSW